MKTVLHRKVLGYIVVALAVLVMAVWSSPASAADTAGGQAIYKKRCAVCHGNGGAGDGPMGKMLKPPPPSLSDAKRMADRSDEDLTKVISAGKGRMPAYDGKLSASQIQDVLAYLRTLSVQ